MKDIVEGAIKAVTGICILLFGLFTVLVNLINQILISIKK